MTVLSSLALGASSVSPNPTGAEVDATRRLIDFTDISYARLSYGGGGVGDCALALMYSLDKGTTFTTLIPQGPGLGAAGVVLASQWMDVTFLEKYGDVVIAVYAYGASPLAGLLYTIKFIDLQLR